MSFPSVLFVAIALSMDSFAVSIALGLSCCSAELKYILRVVLFLSVAQATFALLGWIVGDSCLEYIKNYDHWLAFILLSVIGGQMLYEGIKGKDKDNNDNNNNNAVPTIKSLLLLSIATSIDALITGVSFAFLDVDIFMVIAVILSVTAFFTFIGFTFSGKIGKKCGNYSEIFGGIVLILIGLKVLIEHTLLA